MKKLTFSMPGKMGDMLMQWPVVFQHWQKHQRPYDLWLDKGSGGPLVNLFAIQPGCEDIHLAGGIEHYRCGGQPWDFNLKLEDHLEREFVHLGMREFPQRQITLQTVLFANLQLDTEALCQDRSLTVPEGEKVNRVVLHGNFMGQATGVPTFWRFLADNAAWIRETFEVATFVGLPVELERAKELYPDFEAFSDEGDLLKTATLMADSRLVLSCGSAMAALANCLKVPCARVHDPIGDAPKVIWSGTGPNQLNETEHALRKVFPQWREVWVPRLVVG